MMHTTKDGKQIALVDMSDKHLLATIAMIDRKAKTGVVIQSGGILFCHDEPWYEQHTAYGAEALDAMNAAEYAKEAARRGLTPITRMVPAYRVAVFLLAAASVRPSM